MPGVLVAMTPYYEQDGIVIYHGDCRDVLPNLESVDLVLTDPPYGIGATRMTLGKGKKAFFRGEWDDERPLIGGLVIVGRLACIWGGNYYADQLPVTNDWLCWHKKNDDRSFSEFELAWTNFGCNTRIWSRHWSGEEKLHPTQKPVSLMRWCIERSGTMGLVVDPFMGSGTTLRAAKDCGRKAIGIEIEERYCEIAAKRLQQSVMALEIPA
jgi:site-specific DNA-methyltransferase (adenine-specific)